MSTAARQRYITPEEYLAGERISPIKREYVDGRVYAMAGASDAHVTITVNLTALLWNRLDDSPCRIYTADMKARVEVANIYYYPDVMVTCDPRDLSSTESKRFPCLIMEVLSGSTERVDRTEKYQNYTQLETLEEYVLVSQDEMLIECFRRDRAGGWVMQAYGPGDRLRLESVDLDCPVEQVYRKVIFPGEEAGNGLLPGVRPDAERNEEGV